jgi:hypothetical protein
MLLGSALLLVAVALSFVYARPGDAAAERPADPPPETPLVSHAG